VITATGTDPKIRYIREDIHNEALQKIETLTKALEQYQNTGWFNGEPARRALAEIRES